MMRGRGGNPGKGGRRRLGRPLPDEAGQPAQAIFKQCLACGGTLSFDSDESPRGPDRPLRISAACGECGAVHRLLTDFGVYGLVERH